ncbi:MAG: alpha/beta hydrolase [Chitinophagaceae bacterium]
MGRVLLQSFLLLCFPVMLWAQKATRTTYALKGNDTLWFDHYKPAGASNGISVLFVHGGAFTGGDPVNQAPFAEGMTKLGYNVFVIKYRLYLKGKSFGCEVATPEKLTAIRQAVEDARDATIYLVNNAAKLQVDTSKLFIAGSSAGAETILNLVYNPFLKKGDTAFAFYNKFRYAGALSFSGAVLDINTLYKQPATPLFMMHGDNDQLVPYLTSAHRFCKATDAGWLMMFGAHTIYEELSKRNMPVILYTYLGKGHEVSNYMFRRFTEMDAFMKEVVKGNSFRTAHILLRNEE